MAQPESGPRILSMIGFPSPSGRTRTATDAVVILRPLT